MKSKLTWIVKIRLPLKQLDKVENEVSFLLPRESRHMVKSTEEVMDI